MLKRLSRLLAPLAIPNLVVYLVAAQALTFVLLRTQPEAAEAMALIPVRVLEGEAWRLLTFLFFPESTSPIWILFELMLLYLFGSSLEAEWGTERFNAFFWVGWLATVLASFLSPTMATGNIALLTSIFLAFAYLNPDYEIRLFFILPVKVKYLAWIAWGFYAIGFALGAWVTRLSIAAATVNWFLFFGQDLAFRARAVQRKTAYQAKQRRDASSPTHVCAVCGKTDLSHPDEQFRYCSKCHGRHAYCSEHIHNHVHVPPPEVRPGA